MQNYNRVLWSYLSRSTIQATRMSVNVGTVLLVFTVLSQGAIPLLVLVMLGITVQLVHRAQGRFLVPLEHTVKEQAKSPNCVRMELTNQTSQEPALMTASVALQVGSYFIFV